MNISHGDVVFQVLANPERETISSAARLLIEVADALDMERLDLEKAGTVNGLRTGTLASMTIIRKLGTGADEDERVASALAPVLRTLEVPEFPIEIYGEPRTGKVKFPYGGPRNYGPYRVVLISVGVGVDPLNPEGEEMDYSADAEDLTID
ncbi:hypothetical protein KBZ10_15920 [Streptomyces sp. F63]|uniref:hypothetical protein n=1 Tax=Streptomyces sp. F63 TaxID=2824887 RepID=UPI001B374D18|nr:hypothetical protein [Streptomyces sp. F63]MBQ0985979.1 hypothetical protein [Streptomyces sp. F63]